MRKSQLVIVSAVGFVTLLMIVMAVIGRVALSQSDTGTTRMAVSSAVAVGEQITTTFDVADFKRIDIEGRWQVSLTQGGEWHVEVSHAEDLEDDVNVYVREDRLKLEITGAIGYDGTVAEERVRIAGVGRVRSLD